MSSPYPEELPGQCPKCAYRPGDPNFQGPQHLWNGPRYWYAGGDFDSMGYWPYIEGLTWECKRCGAKFCTRVKDAK